MGKFIGNLSETALLGVGGGERQCAPGARQRVILRGQSALAELLQHEKITKLAANFQCLPGFWRCFRIEGGTMLPYAGFR